MEKTGSVNNGIFVPVPEGKREPLKRIFTGDFTLTVWTPEANKVPNITGYRAQYDVVVSDDTPNNMVGFDGQRWVNLTTGAIWFKHN